MVNASHYVKGWKRLAPRKTDQELTKEIIMNRARELFVKKGYEHVSMREIAKELHCSHGAIYYHFKNKAELFYKIVQADFQLLDDLLNEVLQIKYDTKDEGLRTIFLKFIEFGLTHKSHYKLMFLTKNEELDIFQQNEPNRAYENFAQAIYQFIPDRANPTLIWSLFLALSGLVTKYVLADSTYEEIKDFAKQYVNFLLKGID